MKLCPQGCCLYCYGTDTNTHFIMSEYTWYPYQYGCLSSIGIGMNDQPGIGFCIGMNLSLVLVAVWRYQWNTSFLHCYLNGLLT